MCQKENTCVICITVVILALIAASVFKPDVPKPIESAYRGPSPIPVAPGNCSITMIPSANIRNGNESIHEALLVCTIPGIDRMVTLENSPKSILINAYASIPITPIDLTEHLKYLIIFLEWTIALLFIIAAISLGIKSLVDKCKCCPQGDCPHHD